MEEKYQRLHEHEEPAHAMIVKFYDHLRKLYTHIRKNYQADIDKAFDKVSKEIGFVVVTTLPYQIELGNNGEIKKLAIGAEHLNGTIFDQKLTAALKKFKDDKIPTVSAGNYSLYLLWFDALKLKLLADWVEPAHFRRLTPQAYRQYQYQTPIKPEVMEPVHWFDPGLAMESQEALQISVIDEVYPELRLADRVIASREAGRQKIRTGVREPAHFKKLEEMISPEMLPEFLTELAQVLRRYGFKF